MELRDKILQGKLIFGDAKFLGVPLDPLEQIDGPTTSNIVGNLDHLDLLVFHCGKEDVVHVDKPSSVSTWWQWRWMRDLPLPFLEVNYAILANQAMTANDRTDTRDRKILR